MKRAVVWTTVLTGVFSLGYLTAQSPLILREEMPSASRIAEIVEQRAAVREYRAKRARHLTENTISFLEKAITSEEAEYRKTRSLESRAILDNLKANLVKARLTAKEEPSR